MALVGTYIDSHLAVITMLESETGNRLNRTSLEELSQAFHSSIQNSETRAILLRSNGPRFCYGMDLDYLQSIQKDISQGEMAVMLYTDLLLTILKSPKPIIALINGDVKAGGLGLVAACDIVLASGRSTFELSEVFFGLIPANVLPFLSLRLSLQKAKYLVLTAKKLSAQEAWLLNLVDEVFEEGSLEKKAEAIIKSIFRASPQALAEAKRFTQEIFHKRIDEACDLAKVRLLSLINKTEVLEGINAFHAGDLPSWFGKFKPDKPLSK